MDHVYPYVALSPQSGSETFYENMKPALIASFMFGPYKLFGTCGCVLIRIWFVLLLCAMVFVACIGVFFRSAIDTWIQFALYIVPLLTHIIGANCVNSGPFLRLLGRNVSTGRWATFYVDTQIEEAPLQMPQNSSWVRRNAYKIVIYPLLLEVIQWGVYMGFFLNMHDHSFAGSKPTFKVIEDDVWLYMYAVFWTLSVYSVGVMACYFIFISRLIMRDVISYLNLFGYSPILRTRRSHFNNLISESILGKFLRIVFGFLLFDTFESTLDMYVGSRQPDIKRSADGLDHPDHLPSRAFEDLVGEDVEASDYADGRLTQKEASILLTQFVNEFDEITGVFQPFTVMLTFFAVTNVITHVSLFALRSSELIRFWTFSRTLIWLFTSIRILISVSQIAFVLEKVEPHVKYLRAAGKLTGEDKEWDHFFELIKTFRLKTRSFGFPLNLRQTASLATLLNMAFLIVISVVRAHYGKI